ncbi:MAG: undecaprenyldiphospho-muramoylpentapeptide beta-N-acetylglucosaminyltransferase [Desulfohalobiaceae bacterium]|nr:undecaprenyldiphospho-muramoylpentapeptide beta-N-acetylglucosaminyltransferase [Desulfohalobiaceae bacterium]MCF8106835.1 undecaprenyldiphospho-muramoylpentapeptide beta-N-acetylglucosaminyltransferase [Desulfohalobiaceae bacterium]
MVIATGGTGGHIFPALAVAQALKAGFPGIELRFVGGDSGPESEIIPRAGFPFWGLPAKGVLGKGIISNIGTLSWMLQSLVKCRRFYKYFGPELVLGFGGYASYVPLRLAVRQKRTTVIHEQNRSPGMCNRLLAKRVDRIFLSFPDDGTCFDPTRVVVTGNPVRADLAGVGDRQKKYYGNNRNGKNVLVLGGSQGARAINEAVVKALPVLKSQGVSLRHQTGRADWEKVRQAYQSQDMDPEQVCAFIEDMAAAYVWSDLVVSRAGASTVAELMAVGRPSILIPYPYATGGHQLHNARELEKWGAAMVLEQSYLQEVDFGRMVTDLLAVPEKLSEMGLAAGKRGHPEAAREIVRELERLAGDC